MNSGEMKLGEQPVAKQKIWFLINLDDYTRKPLHSLAPFPRMANSKATLYWRQSYMIFFFAVPGTQKKKQSEFNNRQWCPLGFISPFPRFFLHVLRN